VEDGEALAEAGAEAGDRLRRQPDLRHQHDRAVAAGEGRLDRGQVDLGLAGAGDAVEEQLPIGARLPVESGDDSLRRRLLGSGRPRRLGRRDAGPGVAGAPAHLRAARLDQAAALEAPQRGGVAPGRSGQLGAGELPGSEGLEDRSLARAEPLAAGEGRGAGRRDRGSRLDPRADALSRRAGPRGQHQAKAAGRRGAVLAGNPEAEPDQLRRRPGLERPERLGEPLRRQLGALGDLDDHAEDPARPEGHAEDRADADSLHIVGQPVVERPAQGAGGCQRLDAGDRHPPQGMGMRGRRASRSFATVNPADRLPPWH
jgi:hypothetical protein